MKKIVRFTLLAGLLVGMLFAASACSSDSTSHFGMVTKEVYGKVKFDPERSPAGLLVVALSKDVGFVETATGPLYEVHASLAFVDSQGNYQIHLSDAMREVFVYFIAEGHNGHRHDFSRSLGVGKIEYDVTLQPSDKWDDTFAIQVKSFLSGFIVEQRYKMPGTDQLKLGDWLTKVEERINK